MFGLSVVTPTVKTCDQAPARAVLTAREVRRNSSDVEKSMWRELRDRLPGHKWRRQLPIGPYFADFACVAGKLIVELEGGHRMASPDYDAIRDRFLAQRGYRVLRFSNGEVAENVEGVLHRIADELSTSPSLSHEKGVSAGRRERVRP